MSKMNLKSTLWTLAFAVAAVSCSDELEEGGGIGTGNEVNGEGVYVTVNVSSNVGPTTKAPGDDGWTPEGGDGDLEDSDVESAVHDVNIFLYRSDIDLSTVGNDLGSIQSPVNTAISSGYSTDIQSATGSITHHDLEATVRVSVPELESRYHVITVVNAGGPLNFTTLGQLRDYLQTAAWSGDTNKYDESGKGARNFVMSTHQMYQAEAGGSDLLVTSANTDPSNPAETTVYVERLAARIDMNFKSALVSDDGTAPTNATNDKVKITGYQVVNQMKGGTYMLKRVTNPNVTGGYAIEVTGSIPDGAPLFYLGDEYWETGKYNYVIDPWTLNKKETTTGGEISFPEEITNSGAYYSGSAGNYTKTEANSTPYNLAKDLYINHFWEGLNTSDFLDFNSVAGIQTTNGSFTPLLYVQENTADAAQQKKGFTTGVIFEAEYKPEKISQYQEESGNVTTPDTYTEKTFLVADYKHTDLANRKPSADLRTIAVLGIPSDIDNSASVVKAMFNKGGDWSSITDDSKVNEIVGKMTGGPLVEAFREYLSDKLKGTFADVKTSLTWDAFVEASHDASNGIKYVPSDTDLTNGITGTGDDDGKTAIKVREELKENYNIAYYDDGKCYYKYWIKHEPNGTDDDPMGVMEFAIVRNNVYQLAVEGVSGLGDPLPFTPGEDDPNDPVKEEEEVQILVRLYVRDWVKRSNSSIIL